MKKYLLSSAALMFLLSGITYAAVSSTTLNEVKQKITEERANIKSEIASGTANIKNLRQDLKTAVEIKIGKKLNAEEIKISDQFENAMKNLQDLVTKIDSRIAKMDSSGINTVQSKELLDTAKKDINLAGIEITNLENLLAAIPGEASSSASMKQKATIIKNVKAQNQKTRAAIITARKDIINVINSLKSEVGKNKASTSTETTSIN